MKGRTPKQTSAPKTSRKPNKADDPEQYERFRQAAHELGTNESEEAFDRAFRKAAGKTHKS